MRTHARETITPEVAAEFLKFNTRSRPINQERVDRYCKLMQDGLWKTERGSIKLFGNGEIADGQHRLSAIVKCGITLELWVTRNFPENGLRVRVSWPDEDCS